ncbi:diguanylate cyclase [Oscillatoria amoena NRMC-F 0135]|nr:diguanylate cyclase [Geitlerinema splendidum]MDL5044809.1 diguanylate cyclase [Oscillatoria amoena NRMC-F 0135]
MKVFAISPGVDADVQTQHSKSMDVSILIIGDERFQNAVLALIDCLNSLLVQTASYPSEAIQQLQTQPTEFILCQADCRGALELCYQIKTQSQSSWTYCLLLDDSTDTLASTLMERKVAALEAGADAYLWFPYTQMREDSPLLAQYQALLLAEIQVGLRWVKTCQELLQTNDLLSAIALSDPLTELNNRRALEWELPRQIENARNRGTPLCLLILDVDYFKTINDTYGHLIGDRVLQMLSARLQHNLRFYDTPFRYGGEEFVILLSNTEPAVAIQIAERLRVLIATQPFRINETLDLKIAISAGVAYLRSDDDEQGISLLDRADQNLLQAKTNGRNQVVSCRLPDDSPESHSIS